jgi:hypothetical protein
MATSECPVRLIVEVAPEVAAWLRRESVRPEFDGIPFSIFCGAVFEQFRNALEAERAVKRAKAGA